MKEIIKSREMQFENSEAARMHFQALKARLQRTDSLLQEYSLEEDRLLSILGKRVAKLSELENIDFFTEEEDNEHKKNSLMELLIREFLNKNDLSVLENSSKRLITDSDEDLRDQEMCRKIIGVSNDLANRSVLSALEWCTLHKSKLQKLQSNLEFALIKARFVQVLSDKGAQEGMLYLHESLKDVDPKSLPELKEVTII
jgi:hypothetical protein